MQLKSMAPPIKSAREWAARVRAYNSVNLKPVGIIEALLKILTYTAQLHVDINHCC